ncbi:MAG: hypothetical protein DME26_03305 [Verrucomicrobia bacterium]|nr:MAG: hypothetical protein DME26_03305 [Verrucomicrobiota bacterium]
MAIAWESKNSPTTVDRVVAVRLFTVPLPPFTPGGVASVGLTNIVPDRIIFNTDTPNMDNWEPNISVLGNSTFLIEANTFATDGGSQRFALAFQPVAGGPNATGEVFFADNGTPYRDQINLSRQNGNPGRVAGDKRPSAVNLIGAGEASLYGFPAAFNSDGRFNASSPFYAFLSGASGRDGCIQISSLNTTTLAQTPSSKALDSLSPSSKIAPDFSIPTRMPPWRRFSVPMAPS